MTPENNDISNKKREVSEIIRWITGGAFLSFALLRGLHYSALLFIVAAFLIFPFSFMRRFWQRINIHPIAAVILSAAIFLIGVLHPPMPDYDAPTKQTLSQSTAANGKTTSASVQNTPDNTTSAQPSSSASVQDGGIVWIPLSGTKYHSDPECSNMNSPKAISLDEAQKQGYEPCKRCH